MIATVTTLGCEAVNDASSREETPEIGRESLPLLGFGVASRPNPSAAYRSFQPLMDYLAGQIPFRIQIRLGRSDEDLSMYLEERIAEVAPVGIVLYLDAHLRFGAVPLVKPLNRDGEAVSRSVFITRTDSLIKQLADLKGHSLALGPVHATLSHFLPRRELARIGMDLDDLRSWESMDGPDAVVRAVSEGRFDAGAVGDIVLKDHEGLRCFHVTDTVPSAPLVVRGDLPQHVVEAVRSALLRLEADDADARKTWDESIRYGFVAASDEDYEPMRRLVRSHLEDCVAGCHSDHSSWIRQ